MSSAVQNRRGEVRRVLALHYYFPPLGGIGSVRAAKLMSYLPDFGWEPLVIAPRSGASYEDNSIAFPEERVVRTGSVQVGRILRRSPVALPEAPTGPVTWQQRVGGLARRVLYRPDGQVGWLPFACWAGFRALQRERFDAIYSSSFPITAHVAASWLQRRTGLPWVAEFRDWWLEEAYPHDPGPAYKRRLERRLLAQASAVVTVSESLAGIFREKGARNVHVVTNGYDPSEIPDVEPSPTCTFTHVGSYHPRRQNLSVLWRALADLRGQEVQLRIRFVGPLHPALRAELAQENLLDISEVTGFVPHKDALRHMAEATVLIVAGAREDDPLLEGMIPAKVFEYLGTRRPIIFVGRRRSDAWRLLEAQAACFMVEPGDVDAAQAAVRGAISAAPTSRDLPGHTHQVLSGRLARILEGVRA